MGYRDYCKGPLRDPRRDPFPIPYKAPDSVSISYLQGFFQRFGDLRFLVHGLFEVIYYGGLNNYKGSMGTIL